LKIIRYTSANFKSKIKSLKIVKYSITFDLKNYKKEFLELILKIQTEVLSSKKNKDTQTGVKIYLDTKTCPPTYGDVVHYLMLARLLVENKFKVSFIYKKGRYRKDWQEISKEQRKKVAIYQYQIIQKLLPRQATFKQHYNYLNMYLDRRQFKINKKNISIKGYRLAMNIISTLTQNNLLEVSDSNFLFKQKLKLEVEDFLCMNIRQGFWGQERNTNPEHIVNDFIALRKFYPNFKVMILAEQNALEFFWKIMLSQEERLNSFDPTWKKYILQQTNFTYYEAIDLIQACKFYFQRPNGGMGVIPIYSNIPYLIMTNNTFDFFDDNNKKLYFFSKSNQIFIDEKNSNLFDKSLEFLLNQYDLKLD